MPPQQQFRGAAAPGPPPQQHMPQQRPTAATMHLTQLFWATKMLRRYANISDLMSVYMESLLNQEQNQILFLSIHLWNGT